jgi:hypothetical protein
MGDLFDACLDLEDQHISEGHTEGVRDGRAAGLTEGRELGQQKGVEIGSELGFYAGFVQVCPIYGSLTPVTQQSLHGLMWCMGAARRRSGRRSLSMPRP